MELCFATNNAHKLSEIKQLVGNAILIKGLTDIGCIKEIPETGNTLQENALQKAMFVQKNYGIHCFADDTGLEVDALEGAPGVYSARYAGEPANDKNNVALLLKNMEGVGNRKARFKTVIALLNSEHPPIFFEGIVEGQITTDPKGNSGFGYDPIFVPDGYSLSFAQMLPETKNEISHRAIATHKLVNYLKNYNGN